MSFAGSGGDDQSEDGELRHSPAETKPKNPEILDFSLSDEEDADTADSLDIKPPQNRVALNQASNVRKRHDRERSREVRSRHRSDRHSHREKHHRERSNRDNYRYRTEKELYLRYGENTNITYKKTGEYLDPNYRNIEVLNAVGRRDEQQASISGATRELRYAEARKYDDKRAYRKYDEKRLKSVADQTLDDLRERLLDKKRLKENSDVTKDNRRRVYTATSSNVEQDADVYVKEIIDLSGGSTDDVPVAKKERKKDEEKVTEIQNEEHELRKEKLLQAEREIARQKEQYKLERERRHLRRQERQEKRRLQEQEMLQNQQRKRQRMSDERDLYKDKDLSIVTVSDNSSESSSSEELANSENNSNSDNENTNSDQSENSNSEENVSEENSEDDNRSEESAGPQGGGASDEKKIPDESNSDEEKKTGKAHRKSRFRKGKSPEVGPIMGGSPASSEPEGAHSRTSSRESFRSQSDEEIKKNVSQSPKSGLIKELGGLKEGNKDEKGGKVKPKEEEIPVKKLDENLPPYFPAIQGCRSVEEFQCLNRIEEGTYGVVYRARDKRTEEIVALKRLKMEKEKEGFPITSLREINTLLKGQHPNIVTVREIVVGSNMDKIFIVMDYVEHDLKSLMETMRHRRQVFVPGEIKCLLLQLLGAVAHLHDNWILHRDLKTSNLLLSHKGILKVGDFGLAREYGSPLKAYTPVVVTLWYRAPELLLCCKEYSTPVDMWSVGCIFAELVLMNALFPGKSEVDQLNRIFKDLGTPNDRIWPGFSQLPAVKKIKFTEYPISHLSTRFAMLPEAGRGLLQKLLTYDPAQRVTAEEAMKHGYFREAPVGIEPGMFPTWPAKSELGGRRKGGSPKAPSGGREYKQLGDGDEDSALGFHMGGSSSGASLLDARRIAMGAGFSLKF